MMNQRYLQLIYILFFAVEGILYALWPVWLKTIGFSVSEIGLLIAAAFWPQAISGFILGNLSDWKYNPAIIASFLALLSSICIIFSLISSSLSSYVFLSIIYGAAWTSVLPISESALITSETQGKVDYGVTRSLGSIAFIVSSVLAGFLVVGFSYRIVPKFIALFMFVTFMACIGLAFSNKKIAQTNNKKSRMNIQHLMNKKFFIIVFSCGLIQLSHALYFSNISVWWSNKGYSAFLISIFWGVSVIAEACFFAISPKVLKFLTVERVIAISAFFASVRWLLFPVIHTIEAIIFWQCLHALSFAAYHSALMRFLRDHVPEQLRGTALGFYYSFAVALPMGCMMPVSAYLFENFGSAAYFLMALISMAGAFLVLFSIHRKKLSVVSRYE